jgi:hypothetical protein
MLTVSEEILKKKSIEELLLKVTTMTIWKLCLQHKKQLSGDGF